MSIREVDVQSLPQAAEIHAISWRESHKGFCSTAFVAQHTVQRQMEYLWREIATGKRLYLLRDAHPVGIVSVDGDVIENLYVLPWEQRKGYGTILLRFAIEQCVGAPTLWSLSNNEAAHALYHKHGFLETGNRKQLREKLFEIEMKLQDIQQRNAGGTYGNQI